MSAEQNAAHLRELIASRSETLPGRIDAAVERQIKVTCILDRFPWMPEDVARKIAAGAFGEIPIFSPDGVSHLLTDGTVRP